jgi:hypothetical protein
MIEILWGFERKLLKVNRQIPLVRLPMKIYHSVLNDFTGFCRAARHD